MSWPLTNLGDLITESRIPADYPNADRRIRVRLNVLGVEKRPLENEKEGATKQFIRRAGQFIYGKQNFHKGAFGIVPSELDGFESSADIPSFDVRDDCLPEWIYYYFKIGNRYLDLERIARGVGSKRIHPDQIANIRIPLPDLKTQRGMVEKFKGMENRSEMVTVELSDQLDLVNQLRQAFLREALQGKLVPQDPKDEPASELIKRIKAEKEKLIKEGKIK
ncbi:MAG: restriction endonuclease subunit S, partial [Cyclobacteriaceae bacterium]|nr:restriction endonuclease subunit S [Cyclobacteriaceae bacterium]